MTTIFECHPGDKLRADGGFTCLAEGAVVKIAEDKDGRLYVPCADGRHYLEGQLDVCNQDTLVGLTKVEP